MTNIDPTSTHPNGSFRAKDDRPITISQDSQTKKWRVMRQDSGYEGGGKIIANDLPSREIANEYADKEKTLVPRTDSTHKAGTRKQFTFDHISDEKWERIFGEKDK